ncbi:TonB-dependent receptor domain-containing protein [Sphingopyxis sp. JAI128]|uniref:TonB-dependent receptor family protein n=1 Tax=Sphingopyxis sp. JAI128 TaxID=2723066 RepID=UPI001620B698|nr:TonB-dependent receptor [Sphingopyxis sp. JAI128]MBB6425905.1 iron complex outermembrane receptor protein [Sphingopyxis sp. JAI128]
MIKSAYRGAPLLALVTCLSTAPVHAEEANSTIIVTAPQLTNEAEGRAAKTAGGTDIVGHQDYADKSIVSLRDTLAFSPGVYLQPRYGQEVRISIRGSGLSRGFHMRGLTLLQDGVPTNLADDNGDFQELEPIFFDHLEVYRGGNALRFGSGTLGGAINGVTPTGRTAEGFYLRGDVGSFDSYRGLISTGVAGERVDAWAAVGADTSDGDRDHAKRRSFRFHGNVGMQFSDVLSNRLYVSFNNINQEIPGALTRTQALTSARMASGGAVTLDQARDVDSLRIQNRTRLDWGALTLDVGAFFNVKSLYHPIFELIDHESADRGGFFRFDYAGDVVEATVGGELRVGDIRSKRFVNLAGKRGTLRFNADQDARAATLYGEVRLKPVERLSLIAGGIYADGRRKQVINFNAAAPAQNGTVGRADFDAFSPKFGLLFEPAADVQLYANYNRSAEFPGFNELAQIASFVALDPQRAWTAEIGTRGRAGSASWDLTYYRSDIKGELLQFNVGPTIPASTFNAGRTRHEGVEAALQFDVADWLRLRQVYTYSNFRFRGDADYGDNRLPVVPKHVYRAEIRIGSDTLHIAPNLEWVPDGPFADYHNRVSTPDYALIGVTGGATIADGIDAFVDVRNVTGKKALGDISAAVTVTDMSAIYYPVERRAISAGIRARF